MPFLERKEQPLDSRQASFSLVVAKADRWRISLHDPGLRTCILAGIQCLCHAAFREPLMCRARSRSGSPICTPTCSILDRRRTLIPAALLPPPPTRQHHRAKHTRCCSRTFTRPSWQPLAPRRHPRHTKDYVTKQIDNLSHKPHRCSYS